MVREHDVIIITIERRLFVDDADCLNKALETAQLDFSLDNLVEIGNTIWDMLCRVIRNPFSFLE